MMSEDETKAIVEIDFASPNGSWQGKYEALVEQTHRVMTGFAIALWAWQLTGEATPLSLLIFFNRTPRVIAAIFAGIIVDRFSRKTLMILH